MYCYGNIGQHDECPTNNVSTVIFLFSRVGLSRVMVHVSKHVRSGTEQQRGRSQQVVGWPLESGRDVRVKTCVNGTSLFPKSRVLSERKFYVPEGRGKLLNRSHIGKCNDHHQLIMKAERMKNHGARITYALQPLSVVLYMPRSVLVARMCYGKSSVRFETSSHHEFSVPWHDSTSRPLCYKFWMFCMHSIHQSSLCIVCSSSRKPRLIKITALGPCQIHRAQDKYALHHGNLPKHKEGHAKWQKHWARAPKLDIDQ
jgi:hypothetical protein